MGMSAFARYTRVYATIKVATRCIFGKNSIKSLDKNIIVPSIEKTHISLTDSLLFTAELIGSTVFNGGGADAC